MLHYMEARVQLSGLVLKVTQGLLLALRERTECGRSSFLPIYPPFFECARACLALAWISIDVEINRTKLHLQIDILFILTCRRGGEP